MPRLIFKCPYIESGQKTSAHLSNYVHYMATRDGAEPISPECKTSPATEKQRQLVEQLTKDFPLSRGMFEYQDYLDAPTQGNASEFISRAIEENGDAVGKRENYVAYIAQRPRAEKRGSHALFTGSDDPIQLTRIMREVAEHPGNVWLPIFSLRREDAERLGYDNAERWKILLSSYAVDMAHEMKIPEEQFRWYAAFHNEGHHPHIHMVCYSADGRSGYLTKNGIASIKKDVAHIIFRQDLTELYQQKTAQRDQLSAVARETMQEQIRKLQAGTLSSPEIEAQLLRLSKELDSVKGKKVYGYLRPELKAVVDEIVDKLAEDPRVSAAYDQWYQLREEVLHTYKNDLPNRLPLSQQPELKQLRNMVIREAMAICTDKITFEDAGMADEPEPVSEEDGSTDHTHSAKSYQEAKKILRDTESSIEERQQAIDSLRQMEQRGFSPAAHLLGKCYRDGCGVLADREEAERWFLRSSQAGNDCSQYALGKLLERQKRMDEAVLWYGKAAEQGDPFAQYRLGKLYLQGEKLPKDTKAALKYLTDAAEQGNRYAQYALGKLYLQGREIAEDKVKARYWLEQAAAQGHPYAAFFLEHFGEVRSPTAFLAATRLLSQLGKLLEDQQPKRKPMTQTDKKQRAKLREKRLALGQQVDDHEDEKNEIALVT